MKWSARLCLFDEKMWVEKVIEVRGLGWNEYSYSRCWILMVEEFGI